MPHPIPLIDYPVHVNSSVTAANQRGQRLVVFARIDSVNALLVKSPDSWREPPSQHGKRCEIVFGVSVGVHIVFFQ